MDKIVLQILSLVVSVAYQMAQHRRMKREADKRKGFKINKRGEAFHIPIVYGKQAVGFIEANHKVNNSYTYTASGTGGTEFLSKNKFLNQNRSAKKNQLLLMNGAICQGGIEEVKAIEVDQTIHNKDKDHRHIFHTYNNQLSATAPLGSSNGFENDHKFTGCAHATAAFFLNREEYNYNGIPNCSFFVKGRKVRPVLQSGSNYTLGGYVFSNNPAYILLDYLLGNFGRNLDDGTTTPSSINLKSFYDAGQICASTVMTGATVAGTVNDSNPIEAWNTFSDFPGSPSGTGVSVTDENVSPDVIYKDNSNGNYYSFTETSRNDDENTITGSYASTTLATRNIPLYECNIVLDSEAKIRDNVEAILNTMPLAVLTWTSDGEYKLQLEYPSNQSALNSLAVKTFNNDNVVRDSIDLQWLSASERYNSVTVSFLNEHEDFKEDSKSWPDKSTSAGQNLYNTLLSQDNNQPMSTDMRLEGVTDPYHALAHAEQIGRQSRTFHTCSFIGTKDAIGIEPGDFIKLELPLSDIDGVYRVNAIEIKEDLTVAIDAYFIDINAYAWNISDNDLPGVVSTNTPTFTPDLISNLTWSTTAQFNGVASGNLSWTASPSSDVLYYIVQASTDQTTWEDLGTTSTTSFDVIALKQDTYYWGVRTVTSGGLVSKRVTIGPYNIAYTGPLTQDYIYGTTSAQDTNTQSYDDTLSELTYPYVAVIDYKPDEQPTLPVRTSSGITLNFLPRTSEIVTQFAIYQRATSAPSAPSGGSYNFTTNTLTPPTGWFTSVPIGVGPVYQSNGQASGISSTTNASIASWSTPAVIGAEGADGDSGSRHAIVSYYKSGTSPPSTSTLAANVTYTWATGAVTSSYDGWSTTAPTVDAAGSSNYYYSDVIFLDSTGSATSSTGSSASTATKLFNFNGLVTFTNTSGSTDLNTALADSSTVINGGRITTGTIDATQVNVTNINATGIAPVISGSGQSSLAGDINNILYPYAYHGNFSKNASFTGGSFPSTGQNNTALRAGDIFYNTADNFTYRYNGSSWVKFSIQADSIIANYVYAGTVNATQINAGTLNVAYLPGLTQIDTLFSSATSASSNTATPITSLRTSSLLPSAVWNFGGNGSNHYKLSNSPSLSGLTSGSTLLGTFSATITGSGGLGSPWLFIKRGSTQAYALVANSTGLGARGALNAPGSGLTEISVQLALETGTSSTASLDWHFLDGSSSFKITSINMSLIEFIK